MTLIQISILKTSSDPLSSFKTFSSRKKIWRVRIGQDDSACWSSSYCHLQVLKFLHPTPDVIVISAYIPPKVSPYYTNEIIKCDITQFHTILGKSRHHWYSHIDIIHERVVCFGKTRLKVCSLARTRTSSKGSLIYRKHARRGKWSILHDFFGVPLWRMIGTFWRHELLVRLFGRVVQIYDVASWTWCIHMQAGTHTLRHQGRYMPAHIRKYTKDLPACFQSSLPVLYSKCWNFLSLDTT